jgi:hypothetical protein
MFLITRKKLLGCSILITDSTAKQKDKGGYDKIVDFGVG